MTRILVEAGLIVAALVFRDPIVAALGRAWAWFLGLLMPRSDR